MEQVGRGDQLGRPVLAHARDADRDRPVALHHRAGQAWHLVLVADGRQHRVDLRVSRGGGGLSLGRGAGRKARWPAAAVESASVTVRGGWCPRCCTPGRGPRSPETNAQRAVRRASPPAPGDATWLASMIRDRARGPGSHALVPRPSAALGDGPADVVVWTLALACLAVQAVQGVRGLERPPCTHS